MLPVLTQLRRVSFWIYSLAEPTRSYHSDSYTCLDFHTLSSSSFESHYPFLGAVQHHGGHPNDGLGAGWGSGLQKVGSHCYLYPISQVNTFGHPNNSSNVVVVNLTG
jgi:hypothetical protein